MSGMVPARFLQEVLRGSYEQIIDESSELVAGSFARFGVECPDEVSVVATFPNHVLVSTTEGKFYRATLKDLENGERSIVQTEDVNIPVLRTYEEQVGYVRGAAGEAVAALMSGDSEIAKEHVRELVHSAALVSRPNPVDEMRDALAGLFDRERPWRRVYEGNKAGIHKFVCSEDSSPREYPRPKYQELYLEDTDEPAGYHRAVMADLAVMCDRLSEAWEIVQSYSEYSDLETGFYPLSVAGVNESFQEFAHDYADELRQVHGLVKAASLDEDPETVIPRAVLHDHVARQLPAIDMAARLVRRTAMELKA
jgi:hypothetical protein